MWNIRLSKRNNYCEDTIQIQKEGSNGFMYYIMCLGLLYFLGSHGQKTQAWGASLTCAGYVGHTSFSQDHFVINIECAGSVAQCCDPSVPGRMLLMSHGAHWLHVCTAPGRSSGPSLQLLPGTAVLCLETHCGWPSAASASVNCCLNSPDTKGALFLRVISKCL